MNKHIRIFLVFLAFFVYSQSSVAAISWQHYSSRIFSQAKNSGKLILIYGKASWCHYCQQMNGTFSNSGIATIVSNNFIPVKVDIDTDESVAAAYNISSVPTILIVNSDNRVLDTFSGYSDPSTFAGALSDYVQRR